MVKTSPKALKFKKKNKKLKVWLIGVVDYQEVMESA